MKDSISHQHVLCHDWTRELDFYKTELTIFKSRLGEIVSKNTSNEILTQAEHFENKFKIMNLHFDELLHDLKLKDQALMGQAAAKPNYISIKMIENDNNLEELMQFTASDFQATKKEFYSFLAKYF
jgi:hypothetical protein